MRRKEFFRVFSITLSFFEGNSLCCKTCPPLSFETNPEAQFSYETKSNECHLKSKESKRLRYWEIKWKVSFSWKDIEVMMSTLFLLTLLVLWCLKEIEINPWGKCNPCSSWKVTESNRKLQCSVFPWFLLPFSLSCHVSLCDTFFASTFLTVEQQLQMKL